jgi:hypothetical protein
MLRGIVRDGPSFIIREVPEIKIRGKMACQCEHVRDGLSALIL